MNDLKIIVNCGAAEEWIEATLRSLQRQTLQSWQAHVTVDPCGDATAARAVRATRGDDRIVVTANSRRLYSTANTVNAIRATQAADEDIIVQLDGDDRLYLENALEIIAETYDQCDCWLTYGTWIPDFHAHLSPSELPAPDPAQPFHKDYGQWPAYPEGTTDFRRARWLASHVKTWKKWLWDKVDDRDLRDEDGEYFTVVQDRAIMFPMLEMCGWERTRHIAAPLMVYNLANPLNCRNTQPDRKIRNTEYLRDAKPYRRLAAKPLAAANGGHA